MKIKRTIRHLLNAKYVVAALSIVMITGCANLPQKMENHLARKLSKLSEKHHQALIVTPMGVTDAVVSVWDKKDGVWVQAFDPIPASVGRKGIAPLNKKREGDGRTPSGIFELKTAFGYASHIETGLNYRQATDDDLWVDDVNSPQYNQWVKFPTTAASFERMKRSDDLYKLGIVIEYNTDPVVPGLGSAIFLHIWKGPGQSTSGCVAMDEEDVSELLKWLDVKKSPVIMIQSRAQVL